MQRHLVLSAISLSSIAVVMACGDNVAEKPNESDGATGMSGGTSSSAGGSGGVRLGGVAGEANKPEGGSAGTMEEEPACGDGRVTGTEVCDDGNNEAADGCSATCDAVETGYACLVPGQPCELTIACGDRVVSGSEICDDGNLAPGDGCSADCGVVEAGWICDTPGARCRAVACGDGIIAGAEQCDDADNAAPGCSDSCQMEEGYKCLVAGAACAPTICGDGVVEGTEQCDDANNDLGDGCTPACKVEPDCSSGACKSSCGDGLLLPGDAETCDDGNVLASDGCSPQCMVEEGWECHQQGGSGSTLVLPVVYRDFVSRLDGGHPDFHFPYQDSANKTLIDADSSRDGIVESTLDDDGKPVVSLDGGDNTIAATIESQASFEQWYRDDASVNITVVDELTLTELSGQAGVYRFDSSSFFPLTGRGQMDLKPLGDCGSGMQNFFFTSEVRYYFEFKGGERLDFRGDDDVWVFVNGRLAVDIGGIHNPQCGFVELGPASNPTSVVGKSGRDCNDGATSVKGSLDSFGLERGNVYEIAVFQAERNTCGSNYQLTLAGFNTEQSSCSPVCGDGLVVGDEVCDDGVNDGSYGSCTANCRGFGPRCGDGVLQASEGEICDDGANVTPYDKAGTSDGCAPGCRLPATCGDVNVDSLFGEQCDDGVNDGGFGECQAGCRLGARCGDGVLQESNGEECDDGNNVGGDGCSPSCGRVVIQ